MNELVDLHPRLQRAVDLGCGTGVYVAELRKRGIDTEGYEYTVAARRLAQQLSGVEAKPFDVYTFSRFQESFDACLCIEVAHYLTPAAGSRLVAICAESAPLVVFSAAHPGQGEGTGYGHLNEQPRAYWIEEFARHGMKLEAEQTAHIEARLRTQLHRGFWLPDNVCVFSRISEQPQPAPRL